MGREDVLVFNREFYKSSSTHRKMRFQVRVSMPVIMLAFWCFSTLSGGFDWIRTGTYAGIGLLWYFLYPLRFDRNVMKQTECMLDEMSFAKMLGPCELVLSDEGLRSKSAMGESSYPWSSVDRVILNDAYLFIFLAGNLGYPIPVSQVGGEQVRAAHDFALRHMPSHRG